MTAPGIYCDTDFVAKTGMSPVDLQKVSELGVALNNAAIADKPDDLVINTHVCRGNYHSTYAFEGGYDPIAPYLFANEDVDAFYPSSIRRAPAVLIRSSTLPRARRSCWAW